MAVKASTGLYGLLLHAAGNAESHIESRLSTIGLSLPKLAALHQLVTADETLALGILAELFPDRPVVGIHAVDLVLGFGTLHCLTQQQPA